MPQRVDVALCFDDKLALPAAVSILSALEANPGRLRLHVLAGDHEPSRRLIGSIANSYETELEWIDAEPDADGRFDTASDYGTPSTATYRRIFLPELLPALSRVLYLDADTLVRGDLRPLWQTELRAPLGAVVDPWMATLPAMRAEFPGGYFNAGILLMDLERWRAERITSACIADIARRAALAAARGGDSRDYRNDQTPLNTALEGRWQALSPAWNCTSYLSAELAETIGLTAEESAAIVGDPRIVHFLGAYKPWLPGVERLSVWHAEFHKLRERLEAAFDLSGLAWPGAFTNGPEAAIARRAMALRLVSRAQQMGMRYPAIILTGLLGCDVLEVARAQGLPIAGFASEYPAFAGGHLHDLPIVSLEQAIRGGQREFIVADYRRLARTRAVVARAAAALGATLRLLDVGSLDEPLFAQPVLPDAVP